ncbi:MAG: type II secretion system F family protein, partial [Syntrophobacteraceae bacterium]
MSYYKYQARDVQGEVHRGVLEATSEVEAARKLKSSRLFPVRIKAVRSQARRRIPEEHVIRFFFDLSDLLLAGLPVDRALGLISTNQTHKGFQKIVKDLLESVQGGSDLSTAIGQYRDVFGVVTDHMVRAGEASGTLGPILKRVAQYMEQRRAFRQTLISSMIYPVILLGTSLVSMVILLVYVIPKFAQIFHDLNQKVPFITEVMLQIGVVLKDYGWIIPIALGVFFWGGKYMLRLPQVKKTND